MVSIISYNVAGLRSIIKKGTFDKIIDMKSDIYAFQEIKARKEDINLDYLEYHKYWNSASKNGYSGVLIMSKEKALNVTGEFMSNHEFGTEGRFICLEFLQYYLINVYVPNSKQKLERLNERMLWDKSLREYITKLDKPFVICGDFNVANLDIDIHNPKNNHNSAGFTNEERNSFRELLKCNVVDAYRYLYPEKKGIYTYFSYFGKSYEKSLGWRLDYFVLCDKLKDKIKDVIIYKDIRSSDHVPIQLSIDL